MSQITISFGASAAVVGKNQKNIDEPLFAAPTGSEPAKDWPTSKFTSGIAVPFTTNSERGYQWLPTTQSEAFRDVCTGGIRVDERRALSLALGKLRLFL